MNITCAKKLLKNKQNIDTLYIVQKEVKNCKKTAPSLKPSIEKVTLRVSINDIYHFLFVDRPYLVMIVATRKIKQKN